jgi:hypothetical protein
MRKQDKKLEKKYNIYFFLKTNKAKKLGNLKYCLDNFYTLYSLTDYNYVFHNVLKINTDTEVIKQEKQCNSNILLPISERYRRYTVALDFNDYILKYFKSHWLFN